jgi:hypothetical protein
MSSIPKHLTIVARSLIFAVAVVACSPEVGSDKWCAKIKETDKGQWTADDASNYAKHCIFK